MKVLSSEKCKKLKNDFSDVIVKLQTILNDPRRTQGQDYYDNKTDR